MMALANDIRNARLAVERLLDDFGLSRVAYTIERRLDGWTVRIECGAGAEWQMIALRADPAELCASLEDPSVREKLRRDWAPHLPSCSRRDTSASSP